MDRNTLHIMMNMIGQGLDIREENDTVSICKTANPGIIIELERKENTGNIWNKEISTIYLCYMRFKDIITNRCLLEINLNSVDNIMMLLNLLEEWYSFNCSYDMVYPLDNNTYCNSNRQNLHFSIDNMDKYYNKTELPNYTIYVNEYNPITNENITRIKVNMGTGDEYIRTLMDNMFFTFCIDIPEYYCPPDYKYFY